jgi:hypothetical protein
MIGSPARESMQLTETVQLLSNAGVLPPDTTAGDVRELERALKASATARIVEFYPALHEGAATYKELVESFVTAAGDGFPLTDISIELSSAGVNLGYKLQGQSCAQTLPEADEYVASEFFRFIDIVSRKLGRGRFVRFPLDSEIYRAVFLPNIAAEAVNECFRGLEVAESPDSYTTTLRIERSEPITLDDWRSVVQKRDDVKLDEAGVEATDPFTGVVKTFPGRPGMVRARLGQECNAVFFWDPCAVVTFQPAADYAKPDNPLRSIAQGLSDALGARIVTDWAV